MLANSSTHGSMLGSQLMAVRLPSDVRRAIREDAKRLGVSYGEVVVRAIREKFGVVSDAMIDNETLEEGSPV